MSASVTSLLLAVFLIHLFVFAILGLKRRQVYYVALVVTFSLLSAAMAARLVVPEATVGDGRGLDETLRVAAWPAAAVSIGWTLARVGTRIVGKRRSQ